MNSAIYSGTVSHTRHLPKVHSFSYPFFMWYLDLDEIEQGVNLGRWFSSTRFALSRFLRSDYLGDKHTPLADAVKMKLKELTGKPVTGKIFGLMNLRTLGLYFSPVNFYFGFDEENRPTHFLAEVSNTPWNERHYYAHLFLSDELEAECEKAFKVSPFNPAKDQLYHWKISVPGEQTAINLGVHDNRGHIFEAALRLEKNSLSLANARKFISKVPVMTGVIVSRIYWQALKLFVKGIPFIPYEKEKI